MKRKVEIDITSFVIKMHNLGNIILDLFCAWKPSCRWGADSIGKKTRCRIPLFQCLLLWRIYLYQNIVANELKLQWCVACSQWVKGTQSKTAVTTNSPNRNVNKHCMQYTLISLQKSCLGSSKNPNIIQYSLHWKLNNSIYISCGRKSATCTRFVIFDTVNLHARGCPYSDEKTKWGCSSI